MNRQLVWTARQWPSCEHLHVAVEGSRISADGMIAASPDGVGVRLGYQISCDDAWRTRRLSLQAYGDEPVTLVRSGERWYDETTGTERPELAGCLDVDISLTPFTNTLPIRRLGLQAGQSADLRAVYVRFEPSLEIGTSNQRYTYVEAGEHDVYRYESGSFTADMTVDRDGIVTEYGDLWTLVGVRS